MKKIVFAIPFIALTLAGWAQHKPERDPFVNLAGHKTQEQTVVIHDRGETGKIAIQAHTAAQSKHIEQAPKLNVLGLVTHSGQPKAIVAGGKSTFIVTQGDQLGDYRVARIDRSGITLAYKQNRYHCPLGQ